MRSLLAIVLVSSPAEAGDFDAMSSVDFFRGEAKSDAERFAAQEIGIAIHARFREIDDRLHAAVDYRGREPVGGDLDRDADRLLYQGEIGFIVLEDTLDLTIGRFVAAGPAFLALDGLRVDLDLGGFHAVAYGGRRAITSSRRNVRLGDLLPVAGGGVRYVDRSFFAAIDGAFARDQVPLIVQRDAEVLEDHDSGSLVARASGRPLDWILLGGALSFVERAAYVLGPTWSSARLDALAFNFYGASLYADVRPLEWLQLAYDGQFQRAAFFRSGTTDAADEIQDPNFFDNQLTVGVRPLEIGWARGSVRFRLRNDRREMRYGLSVEAHDLGIDGPYLGGHVFYEDVTFETAGPDLDRLLWKAFAGYRGFGLDASAGVSFLERMSGPLSGLAFDPRSPGAPSEPDDLSPLVLEARRIFFLRLFYAWTFVFAGGDLEVGLDDREILFFVQAGAVWGTSW
jgi:hypothetical protein